MFLPVRAKGWSAGKSKSVAAPVFAEARTRPHFLTSVGPPAQRASALEGSKLKSARQIL